MDQPSAADRPRRVDRGIVAVAVVLLALAGLFWVAGLQEVLVALARLDGWGAAVVVVAGLLPLAFWGVELWLVLAGIDAEVGTLRAVALFVAAGFLNNVTPFGEVGGDPPSGLLIAAVCRISFERGLAAILSVHAVNRVAVLALGALGVALLGPEVGGVGGTTGAGWTGVGWTAVEWSPAAGLAVWTALLGILLAAWLNRAVVVEAVGPPLAASVVRVSRRLPVVTAPTESAVDARIRGFVAALERLAADPPRLLAALALGVAGHLAVAATLWLAVDALGVSASVPAVLVVVPLAKLSGLSPTPGGAGSAVVLLAGLLVAVAGVPAAEATAAALVYRTAAFWVPTAIGGVVTAGFVGWVVPE